MPPKAPDTRLFQGIICRPSTKKRDGTYHENPKPVFQERPTKARPGYLELPGELTARLWKVQTPSEGSQTLGETNAP